MYIKHVNRESIALPRPIPASADGGRVHDDGLSSALDHTGYYHFLTSCQSDGGEKEPPIYR